MGSVKQWQKTYFYVSNVDPEEDFICLPEWVPGPPAEPRDSSRTRPVALTEGASVAQRCLRELRDDEGLDFADLLLTFTERRVLPLQHRPHLICDMSGRRDHSQTCTKPLSYGEVARLMNHISSYKVSDSGWAFGKPRRIAAATSRPQ